MDGQPTCEICQLPFRFTATAKRLQGDRINACYYCHNVAFKQQLQHEVVLRKSEIPNLPELVEKIRAESLVLRLAADMKGMNPTTADA